MHQCNWFKSKESESQYNFGQPNFVLWIESNLNEVHYECFITVMISYDLIEPIFYDCNFNSLQLGQWVMSYELVAYLCMSN